MALTWKLDATLKKELEKYVNQSTPRNLILDFVQRDYPQYNWSLRTLCRRLYYFNIKYTKQEITCDQVKEAVLKELDGPGNCLGYRAMHKKVRQQHGLNVPRDLVYAAMVELNPEGLQSRVVGSKKKSKREHFISKGPNWVHSMDGHCKLMGYQRSTFPLAVYGSIDTASRKIMWMKLWTDNSDPKLVARWYFDHLYINKMMPSMIRIDKGSETGILATMHSYLKDKIDDFPAVNSVIYGKSTSNQIERWWRELHDRLEKYFKRQLLYLKDQGYYDPGNDIDRKILAFVYIPVIQKEIDVFVLNWNTHKIRVQKDKYLPSGVPEHIFNFPEKYDLEQCGHVLSDEILHEVAQLSGVLDISEDYLPMSLRETLEKLIPNANDIEPKNCAEAFKFIKKSYK